MYQYYAFNYIKDWVHMSLRHEICTMSRFEQVAQTSEIHEVHGNFHHDLLSRKGTELYTQKAYSHVAPE